MDSSPSVEQVVAQHTDLVRGLATNIAKELDILRLLEDLIAWGFAGLLDAHARFDPSRAVPFPAFAYPRVRGAIYDGVGKMDLPRRTLETCKRAVAAARAVDDGAAERRAEGHEGEGTIELSDAIDDLLGRLAASQVAAALAADEQRRSNPEEAYVNAFQKKRLVGALDVLDERERRIIHRIYYEDWTLEAVAAEEGVTKQRISQIHVKALAKMRASLG